MNKRRRYLAKRRRALFNRQDMVAPARTIATIAAAMNSTLEEAAVSVSQRRRMALQRVGG